MWRRHPLARARCFVVLYPPERAIHGRVLLPEHSAQCPSFTVHDTASIARFTSLVNRRDAVPRLTRPPHLSTQPCIGRATTTTARALPCLSTSGARLCAASNYQTNLYTPASSTCSTFSTISRTNALVTPGIWRSAASNAWRRRSSTTRAASSLGMRATSWRQCQSNPKPQTTHTPDRRHDNVLQHAVLVVV